MEFNLNVHASVIDVGTISTGYVNPATGHPMHAAAATDDDDKQCLHLALTTCYDDDGPYVPALAPKRHHGERVGDLPPVFSAPTTAQGTVGAPPSTSSSELVAATRNGTSPPTGPSPPPRAVDEPRHAVGVSAPPPLPVRALPPLPVAPASAAATAGLAHPSGVAGQHPSSAVAGAAGTHPTGVTAGHSTSSRPPLPPLPTALPASSSPTLAPEPQSTQPSFMRVCGFWSSCAVAVLDVQTVGTDLCTCVG